MNISNVDVGKEYSKSKSRSRWKSNRTSIGFICLRIFLGNKKERIF